MPRASRQQKKGMKYLNEVRKAIQNNQVDEAVGKMDPMPQRELVRDELMKQPFNILDRRFRVIEVEDLGNYKVYIQIPGEKSDYDFFVWRAIFYNSGIDLRIPTHDDLGKMYLGLKSSDPRLNEYLLNAVLRFIRDRRPLDEIVKQYFNSLQGNLLNDLKKFLLTLKWIALQEDANYPPPQLGSLYALSVYAILEITGDLSAVRKIIRF